MSQRAWILVSIVTWLGSVVVAFLIGVWAGLNQFPLPLVGP